MWVYFFLFTSVWHGASWASTDLPKCAAGKSVCFEHGDHGAVFVFHHERKQLEAVCHDNWDKVDADVACREAGFPRGALQQILTKD